MQRRLSDQARKSRKESALVEGALYRSILYGCIHLSFLWACISRHDISLRLIALHMQLPPHRLEHKRRLMSATRSLVNRLWKFSPRKVDILCHGIKESNRLTIMSAAEDFDNFTEFKTYRLSMPSSSAPLKPAQMSTSTGRTHHHARIQPNLIVRHSFISGNRIILRMQAESRDPNIEDRVYGASVTVIGVLSRIAPSGTLDFAIEFMKVLDAAYALGAKGCVLNDLLAVLFEQLSHRGAHGFAVDV